MTNAETVNVGIHVADMVEKGFDVSLGKHMDGLLGYYAAILPPDTEECGECDNPLHDWDTTGHGFTLLTAILNGELIAAGHRPTITYIPDDFRHSNTN